MDKTTQLKHIYKIRRTKHHTKEKKWAFPSLEICSIQMQRDVVVFVEFKIHWMFSKQKSCNFRFSLTTHLQRHDDDDDSYSPWTVAMILEDS